MAASQAQALDLALLGILIRTTIINFLLSLYFWLAKMKDTATISSFVVAKTTIISLVPAKTLPYFYYYLKTALFHNRIM